MIEVNKNVVNGTSNCTNKLSVINSVSEDSASTTSFNCTTYECFCCKCDLRNLPKCYMRSECSEDNKHHGICLSCHSKNLHSEHNAQMSLCKMSHEYEDSGYCDSCRNLFTDPKQWIFICKTCNEIYCLCKKCYNRKYHVKHRDAFTKHRVHELSDKDSSDSSDDGG